MGQIRMGPTGVMWDDRQKDRERDRGSREVLRSRYAEGELTDAEFDAKSRRLGGP